jgi:hypothetical protein
MPIDVVIIAIAGASMAFRVLLALPAAWGARLRLKRLAGVFCSLRCDRRRDFLLEAAHRWVVAARRPIGRA